MVATKQKHIVDSQRIKRRKSESTPEKHQFTKAREELLYKTARKQMALVSSYRSIIYMKMNRILQSKGQSDCMDKKAKQSPTKQTSKQTITITKTRPNYMLL